MAWKPGQIKLFMAACRAAGIGDDYRYLILGQCEGRAVVDGRISAKSPRLTNDDFEHCMSVVERSAGGQMLNFAAGHWQRAADTGVMTRARFRIDELARRLAGRLPDWREDPRGRLLAWIRHSNCASADRIDQVRGVEDLHLHELRHLIDSMTALAKRHQIPTHRSAA